MKINHFNAGHGLSSQLPNGMYYSAMNYVIVLNMIRQYYKWDKLSFCSHSMGANISTMYAALYPDWCDLLIGLDAVIKPYRSQFFHTIQTIGSDFIALDAINRQRYEPPTYTYNEMIEHWAVQANITIEGIKCLAVRGISQSKVNSNQFYFTRDIRLKAIDFGETTLSDNVHYKLIERISAPHLFIKAGKSNIYEGPNGIKKIVDTLSSSNPKFEWICVDGAHHCHLTDPELVSEHISNFINKYRSKSIEIKHKM